MPSDAASPDTVSEAVAVLEAEGYAADLYARPEGIRCGACGRDHNPAAAEIHRIFRFEGTSDPGDEAIVVGLVCPACGSRGVLVAAYGPTADPEVADVVAQLEDRRDG